MPNIDSHSPGSFCWMELATTDQQAAKQFYSELFGWTPMDKPMGPDEIYTIFELNGREASAAYTLRQEQREHGVPPHWLIYIATSDVEATAARAKELGAVILGGPFAVGHFGKLAIVKDPTGAPFCAWQPLTNQGIGIKDEPGTFCWADLMTQDTTRAKEFYTSLFDWKMEPGPSDPSGYLHIKNGENFMGGMPPPDRQPPDMPPHWLLYYMVVSCDTSTDKVKHLGGYVFWGPASIPNVGRMSIVTDPQGAVFSLFEPAIH